MASFAYGTRDEPYMPPPGQTPCCWSAACHGGTRNIYKLKATSCGLFCIRKPCPRIRVRSGMHFPLVAPLGNCIPFRSQIPGRIFRQAPQTETASHSEYIQRTLATVAPTSVKKKASRISRLSLFVLFCTKHHERRSYSPSTAFLAAAAMLSRSSLVGWSFAANQLSSSIL